MEFKKLFIVLVAAFSVATASTVSCIGEAKRSSCTFENFVTEAELDGAAHFEGIMQLTVKSMSPEILQNLLNRVPALRTLDIDSNGYTDLAFIPLMPEMKWLRANNNKITTVAEGTFNNMPKIEEIWLNNNEISTVAPAAFQNLLGLEKVFFSNNHIENISIDFHANPKLEELDLSHNPIHSASFQMNDHFETLNMNTTNLNTVHIMGMTGEVHPEGVESLQVKGKLEELILDNNYLQNLHIDPSAQLEELSLTNCSLTDISSFSELTTLRKLILMQNRDLGPALTGNAFWKLTELKTLCISETNVKVTKELLEKNTKIKYLNLSKNGIHSFDLGLLSHMKGLFELNMESNGMTELKGYEEAKELLPKLTIFKFGDNKISTPVSERFAGRSESDA